MASYSGENERTLKKIFKLQKRVIRLIANVFNTTSCKPYFNKLKFMALPYIYSYKIPVHMNMSLNRFKTNSLICSYNTRNKYDVFVTGHNTKLLKQSFTNIGVLIFNKPSSETVNSEPVMKFKKILFNFFFFINFYSVEEFKTTDSQLVNAE
jgi:hypothetical protein